MVPAAASLLAVCLRRSVSAFCALSSDCVSFFSAAGSLNALLRREEEDREDDEREEDERDGDFREEDEADDDERVVLRAWGIPVS